MEIEFFNWRRFLATKIIFIKIVPVGSIRCSRGRRMDREPCHDIQSHVPASNSRSLDSEVSRSDVCIFSSRRLYRQHPSCVLRYEISFLRDRWKTNCLDIYTYICKCTPVETFSLIQVLLIRLHLRSRDISNVFRSRVRCFKSHATWRCWLFDSVAFPLRLCF